MGNEAMNYSSKIATWFQLTCETDFTSILDNSEAWIKTTAVTFSEKGEHKYK